MRYPRTGKQTFKEDDEVIIDLSAFDLDKEDTVEFKMEGKSNQDEKLLDYMNTHSLIKDNIIQFTVNYVNLPGLEGKKLNLLLTASDDSVYKYGEQKGKSRKATINKSLILSFKRRPREIERI